VNGLVVSVASSAATVKLGPYTATVTAPDFAWTGKKSPREVFEVGDLALFQVVEVSGKTARVQLEQEPAVQGALVAIENHSGEIEAMVGGYSFEESKFNRATQALRQAGSSFKPYVYAAALEQGATPFDTVVDAPISFPSPQGIWTPRNYDQKFEGTITYRRALAESRNIPAIKVAEQVGMKKVVEVARRFGIRSRLEPYLPVAIGAADLTLLEHTSAFTTFPNDGVRVEPYYIRKVTTYDGTILEEHKPVVHDVVAPVVARTMVAALSDVISFGTGVRARSLGRSVAGKTGTTNEWTDAWFIGFSPSVTCGVWIGFDDKRLSLGKGETGARAALPTWIEFMQTALARYPDESFPNVIPLSEWPQARSVKVDTPDTAPTTHEEEEELTPSPLPPGRAPSATGATQRP
jgi:penicillin-binding protein 1A